MKRSSLLVLLLGLWLLAPVRPAEATDCAISTFEEQVAWADAIVIGQVVEIDDSVLIRSGNTIGMPDKGIPHTLQIERVYKGEIGSRLTVHQRWVIGAPSLQLGDRWLLFLYTNGFGNLTAGPCTPSTNLPPGGEPGSALAAALGPGWAPGEGGPGEGSIALWGVGAVVVALAGAVPYALWRRQHNRRP